MPHAGAVSYRQIRIHRGLNMLEKYSYELWNGNCLELMKSIPDKSIDMILCDLPYGTTKCKWDIVIPFKPMWDQYSRIA